jgi:hypothetical protein
MRDLIDEDEDEAVPPACEWGMAGWCGQVRNHARCYFNHPDGIAAVRAGTYGRDDAGHQWVCPCPCHEAHSYPPCPSADHEAGHQRTLATLDHHVQQRLF